METNGLLMNLILRTAFDTTFSWYIIGSKLQSSIDPHNFRKSSFPWIDFEAYFLCGIRYKCHESVRIACITMKAERLFPGQGACTVFLVEIVTNIFCE